MIPAGLHSNPDIDAWCIACGKSKWDQPGERCRPRPEWHRPDQPTLGQALARRRELARQVEAGRRSWQRRTEDEAAAVRALG